MTFSQSIKSVFSKYATFSGRASRSEYWYFVLLNIIVCAVVYILVAITGGASVTYVSVDGVAAAETCMLPTWAYVVLSIYTLAILLPSLAVAVRRMHDIGNGGGWIFINLIPLIGSIWFLVYTILPSQLGANRFGPQPE